MDYTLFIKPVITLVSFVLYLVILTIVNSIVSKFGIKRKFIERRIIYVKKFFTLFLISLLLIVIVFIWGIDIKGVLIFASSFFAIVGIALFASWSVLSNITSGIIIFFSFPYKSGDEIKIIDGDNSVRGKILDLTLFHIQIIDESENVTFYPNNLAIQKPISKLKSNS